MVEYFQLWPWIFSLLWPFLLLIFAGGLFLVLVPAAVVAAGAEAPRSCSASLRLVMLSSFGSLCSLDQGSSCLGSACASL